MNISGSEILIISEGNILNGLTKEGGVTDVEYFDLFDDQFPKEKFVPDFLEKINGTYFFVQFSSQPFSVNEIKGSFVRKSDGAVFKRISPLNKHTAPVVKRDLFFSESNHKAADGNFYYLSDDGGGLRKINISDPEVLLDSPISPPGESLDHMRVVIDKNGNAVYETTLGQINVQRVVKVDGSLGELSLQTPIVPFLSPQGDAYVIADNEIYKVTVDEAGNITTPLFGTVSIPVSSEAFAHSNSKVVATNSTGNIFEVYNETSTPHLVSNISDIFSEVSSLAGTANHYYLLGTDSSGKSIYRIDYDTHTPTLILDSSEYLVAKMVVTSDDKIVFHGIRLSDGLKVTGKVESPNQVTIITELNNRAIIDFENIL